MKGYDLHPEVIVDLDEIWEFIAADSIAAADKVNDGILDAIGLAFTIT
jgi:plasmid stabilization system protein ParE